MNISQKLIIEECPITLPSEYTWDAQSGTLFYINAGVATKLSNFVPVPFNRYSVKPTDGSKITETRVSIKYYSVKGTIAYDTELKGEELTRQLFPRHLDLIIYSDTPKAAQKLLVLIRELMYCATEHIYTQICNLGMQNLGNEKIYVGGNMILGKNGLLFDNSLRLDDSLLKWRLDVDDKMDEASVAEGMLRLINVNPSVVIPLISALVLGTAGDLFKSAGYRRDFWLILVGPSGKQKTTLAELCCCLFNRNDGVSACTEGLMSTASAVESFLETLHSAVVIIDDLAISESKAEMRKQEEILNGLLRSHTNRTPRRKQRGNTVVERPSEAFVVVTSERPLSTYSVASRSIFIEVSQSPNLEDLTVYQENRLLVSTFARYFIPYLLREEPGIVERLVSARKEHISAHKETSEHIRVLNHGLELEQAFSIFVEYCAEVLGLDERESYEMKMDGKEVIQGHVSKHIDFVKSQSVRNYDYVTALANHFQTFTIIHSPTSPEQLTSYDGFEIRGDYYIRTDSVVEMMRNAFKDEGITVKSITAQLKNNHVLFLDESGDSTKKRFGRRFLHINMGKLDSFKPKERG